MKRIAIWAAVLFVGVSVAGVVFGDPENDPENIDARSAGLGAQEYVDRVVWSLRTDEPFLDLKCGPGLSRKAVNRNRERIGMTPLGDLEDRHLYSCRIDETNVHIVFRGDGDVLTGIEALWGINLQSGLTRVDQEIEIGAAVITSAFEPKPVPAGVYQWYFAEMESLYGREESRVRTFERVRLSLESMALVGDASPSFAILDVSWVAPRPPEDAPVELDSPQPAPGTIGDGGSSEGDSDQTYRAATYLIGPVEVNGLHVGLVEADISGGSVIFGLRITELAGVNGRLVSDVRVELPPGDWEHSMFGMHMIPEWYVGEGLRAIRHHDAEWVSDDGTREAIHDTDRLLLEPLESGIYTWRFDYPETLDLSEVTLYMGYQTLFALTELGRVSTSTSVSAG